MTETIELDLPRRGAFRLFGQAPSWEEKMFRLIAIVSFAFVTTIAAQATPVAPVQEPDSIITQAAAACAGRTIGDIAGRVPSSLPCF